MNYKELNDLVMPEEKRRAERKNFWVAWIVRPLSILFTLPFINSKITPTNITEISVIVVIIGASIMMLWPCNVVVKLMGWSLFFLWAILDGVDGNLARATGQCSKLGELWDAIGGYSAMVLIYFTAGIVAFFDQNVMSFCEPFYLLIMGGATAILSIFPRLVLHKKEVIEIGNGAISELKNKKDFSCSKVIAMNFLSVSGFLQVIFLVCILTHTLNWFIMMYCFLNFLMMIISMRIMIHK